MKPMKKTEYRDVIETLGLSQLAAGRFLDIGDRTTRRYAAGNPIPSPVAILLRYMIQHNLKPEDIRPEWNDGKQ